MSIWLWKVLDNPVIEACLGPALWLGGLTVAAVLLPEGSGLESAAETFAFFTTLILIWSFIGALLRPLSSR